MVHWYGYPRPDGSYGARNYIAVLPTVSCANDVSNKIASIHSEVTSLAHNTGCALLESGYGLNTTDILINIGLNPNLHSILVIGLGCETVSPDKVADKIADAGKDVKVLLIQEHGSRETISKGINIVRSFLEEADKMTRRSTDISSLVLGVECGGSDWTSGILSNPALGYAADLVIENGGTVILGETTELIGAEHILIERAVSVDVSSRIREIINRYINDIENLGGDIYGSNPSRGNIEGGLSTIEEKALGAVSKGGSKKITEVIDYGAKPSKKGLVIMDTPGYDTASVSGMIAGGSQAIVFTTGRGSPFGNMVSPTLKVTANPLTYMRMKDDIDLFIGDIINTANPPEKDYIIRMGERIFNKIIDIISGSKTKSESYGYTNIYIWRRGLDL